MKKAVFPGTFDPITLGHVDIINRASLLFDEIVIAICVNTNKKTLFSLEQRTAWVEAIFSKNDKITVQPYDKLTVDFCREQDCSFILRCLRNSTDFDYESHIAQLNRKIGADIETVFILCAPELSYISSTIVRDLITYDGDYQSLVPQEVVIHK